MKIRLFLIVSILSTSISIQTLSAQNTSLYWSLAGNSNATAASKLGTTNLIPLRLFTNNAERLRIQTNGRIGIGTTNPSNIFTVKATADCKVKVMAYENMGNEQLVYLSLANHTLIARRPPADIVEIGNEIGISFSKNKIIFMQEENGEVI